MQYAGLAAVREGIEMTDWYVKKTFATLLSEAVELWGPREVLCHDGQRWSFRALQDEVDAAAKGFIAQGIEAGESVTLWMPNRVEWIVAFFALSKIGAVVVPINTRFRSLDLEYVVRQSDCRVLVTVERSGRTPRRAVRSACQGPRCTHRSALRSIQP